MDNKKKPPVVPAACLAAMAVAQIIILISRDGFIINYGIKRYNSIRLAFVIATVLCAAWTGTAAMLYIRARKRLAKAEHDERIDKIAAKNRPMDETDRQKLYGELEAFSSGKWAGLGGIGTLIRQLDSMNEYQAEMGRLLDQDDYLKNKPAEIVQRVEDCMYINIRKLLNYMRVVQTKSRSVMQEKIAECEAKNAALLKKTDDFVVAVVAYINGDMAAGEEEKTRESVDQYMYVVLQAIELPEAYLK